jgi:hypothetical protein
MFKKFVVAAALLVSGFAHADVDGSWIGWTYWSFDNSPVKCDTKIAFHQTTTSFERLSGNLECGLVAMGLPAKKWTLDQGKIFEDDQVVGSYDTNQMTWTENYSETVQIQTELKVDARHMDYYEKWVRKSDNDLIYEIKGRLFLQD